MDTKNDLDFIKKKLADYFKNHEEIRFSYIFGSITTKKTNKFSDIDVAIFIDFKRINVKNYRYGYQAEILTDLMQLLGTKSVDLVILNHAKSLLRHQVIYYGKLIYSISEQERINFQVDTINKYMDYKFLNRKIS